jgi:aspartate/methionine/tyrosine aminotransferase
MKSLAIRTDGFRDSIFGVMSREALAQGAINLAQGFPNFNGPEFIRHEVTKAMDEGHNQYAPFPGVMMLRNSIKDYYRRFYKLDFDSDKEITVTFGATEALYLAMMALLNPGDEIILMEPYYDSYFAGAKLAGANPVAVTLYQPDFKLNLEELEQSITSKTKCLVLNNPHNPTGKVWSQSELDDLADIVEKHDLYLISDEVYEFLTFDNIDHKPSSTLKNLKQRTVTISSAGKTFGMTGWKVGWLLANEDITQRVRILHQNIVFSVNTPMQMAVAKGLDQLESYLPSFRSLYNERRCYFYQGLMDLGFKFSIPQGTYFMMVPIGTHTTKNDVDFAWELMREYKVATIPPSAFYNKSDEGSLFLRFCFAKTTETLQSALENLKILPQVKR